jgi:hypothetical protein
MLLEDTRLLACERTAGREYTSDLAAEDLPTLDPGGDIDSVARLMLQSFCCKALAEVHEGAGLVVMGLARNGVGNWDLALGVTEFQG